MLPKKTVYKKTTPIRKMKTTKTGANALGVATISVCNKTLQRNGILKTTSVTGGLNFPETFNSQQNADLNFSNMLGIKGLNMNFKVEVSCKNLRSYKRHFAQGNSDDETPLNEDIMGQDKNNSNNELNSKFKQKKKRINETIGGLSQSNKKGTDTSSTTSTCFVETQKKNYKEVNIKIRETTNHMKKRQTEAGESSEVRKFASSLEKLGTTLSQIKNTEKIRNNNDIITTTPNLDEPMASSSSNPVVNNTVPNEDISDELSNGDAEQDPKQKIYASELSNEKRSQNCKLPKRTKNLFKTKASLIPRKGIRGNEHLNKTKHPFRNSESADCHRPSQNLTNNITGNNSPLSEQTQLNFQHYPSISRYNFSRDVFKKINNEVKSNKKIDGVSSQVLLQPSSDGFRNEQCSQAETREDVQMNEYCVQPMVIKKETVNNTPNQACNSMNIDEINQRPTILEFIDLT